MAHKFSKRFLLITFFLLLFPLFFAFKAFAISNPSISLSSANSTTESISITFDSDVPKGNITDIEVYNSNNQRVHQYFTDSGGRNFNTTTPNLAQGLYTISVGLFNPNWSSNYQWFDKISTFGIGIILTPTPTSTPTPTISSQSSLLQITAKNVYNDWKSKYVISDNNGALRVVRPENNNDTVSEGIGYGMLLAAYQDDEPTFSGLLQYEKKHLDSRGLMNWNIDSSNNTIGQGSATDADCDMAFALSIASNKWQGGSYTNDGKNMINAIMNTEVTSDNLINPGDNWGTTRTINPSYIAPSYYKAFQQMSGNSRWSTVFTSSLHFLATIANPNTGLVPDWSASDYSNPDINFDQNKNAFYYDALRTPMRLLHTIKLTNDQTAKDLLAKEFNFFKSVGVDHLTSGYTLDGHTLNNYLDVAFESAYAASGQYDANSDFAKSMLQKLISDTKPSYFGSTLRALTLTFAVL